MNMRARRRAGRIGRPTGSAKAAPVSLLSHFPTGDYCIKIIMLFVNIITTISYLGNFIKFENDDCTQIL